MRLRALIHQRIAVRFVDADFVRCEIRRIPPVPDGEAANPRSFMAKGTVMELKPDGRTVVIQPRSHFQLHGGHDHAVQGEGPRKNWPACTGAMKFHSSFTSPKRKAGWSTSPKSERFRCRPLPTPVHPPAGQPSHPLLDYKFTNELGQAVSLNDFRGQALAITFFYTRCPLPDYCPRLSKNFQEAQQKLESLPGAPGQLASAFHFLRHGI